MKQKNKNLLVLLRTLEKGFSFCAKCTLAIGTAGIIVAGIIDYRNKKGHPCGQPFYES